MTATANKSATNLELVALGGSTLERKAGRKAVAQSEVSIRLETDEAVEKCLRALEASDVRLAEVPQRYDWIAVWKESVEGEAGATVRFGVVWYDEEFFTEKKDIYLDKRHLAMFSGYGADESEVEVRHFVLAA